jgi:hypothetical protein
MQTRPYNENWLDETGGDLSALEFSSVDEIEVAIEEWIDDDGAGVSAAADLLHGIRNFINRE